LYKKYKMDLNYTVAILNMTIFLFLLEGMVIYNKEKIKNSFMFLLFSLLFIYLYNRYVGFSTHQHIFQVVQRSDGSTLKSNTHLHSYVSYLCYILHVGEI